MSEDDSNHRTAVNKRKESTALADLTTSQRLNFPCWNSSSSFSTRGQHQTIGENELILHFALTM